MQASIAGLGTYISGSNDYLELKVYGFNDKLPALLSKILTTAKIFLPTYDRFKVCCYVCTHSISGSSLILHIDENTLLVSGLVMTK